MNTADKASPIRVPATPKRAVMAAAAGEAIPTARILGRSKTVGFHAHRTSGYPYSRQLAEWRYRHSLLLACITSRFQRPAELYASDSAPVNRSYENSYGRQRSFIGP